MMAKFGDDTPKVLSKITASCLGNFVNPFVVESLLNFCGDNGDPIGCQAHWLLKRTFGRLSSSNCNGRVIPIGTLSLDLYVRAPPIIFAQVMSSTVMRNYSVKLIKTCLSGNGISNTHLGIFLQSCADVCIQHVNTLGA